MATPIIIGNPEGTILGVDAKLGTPAPGVTIISAIKAEKGAYSPSATIEVSVTEIPTAMTPPTESPALRPASAASSLSSSPARQRGVDSSSSSSPPSSEKDDDEEEEEFSPLSLGRDLAPLPAYKDAGVTETDLGGLLKPAAEGGPGPLRLREDLADGCGGILWQAGLVLASYMLRYHAAGGLVGKRILELGAGGGLVGLAVAKGCELGGERHPPLLLTDQLEMFSLMKHNTALNNLQDKVTAEILNWGEPLPDIVRANPPDVVLAADCVYFEPAFPLLLTTLADLITLNDAAVVYFCFKKRRRADMHFLKQLRKRFSVAEVEDSERPVWSRQGLFLYTVRAKGR